MSDPNASWWAPTEIEVGEGLRWRFGPLDLALYRSESEWHLGYQRDDDGPDPEERSREPLTDLPEMSRVDRFAAGETSGQVSLQPRVADRSLVARPRAPLYVLPGERAKVYVSSPLWIEPRVGDPPRSLLEVPVKRLSDTWFGPSTREGEVAYALKTQARVRLEDVEPRPHRCVTPVVFENRGSDVLLVDRMNLPIPFLALYWAADRHFWTQRVLLKRGTGDDMAELDVRRGPPREAVGAERVSEARRKAEANLLVRAFSSLMRPFAEED